MDAYRNYTREHRLFMENADLLERLDFAERYAKELEDLVEQMHGALDEIWPDYMATYPSSAELLERYPVLKEHTVWPVDGTAADYAETRIQLKERH